MTIIEQIKAEIENALHILGPGYSEMEMGQISAYGHILSFLSTLESEKPMNQKGLEREIERCLWQLSDDPSNEELRMFARHFAQWGAEHLKK